MSMDNDMVMRKTIARAAALAAAALAIGSAAIAWGQAAPPAPVTTGTTGASGAASGLPTTITGESAPPLPVAPPPDLAPQVVPALPAGAPSLVPAGTPLTADQAVALALSHQPAVGIARQGVAAAASRVQQATSALLPSVGVSSSYSSTSTSRGAGLNTGSGSTYGAAVSARQLLFDFGHTQATVRSTRRQEAAQRAALERQRQDTAFSVRQAYFTLLQDQRLADIAQQTVDAQRAHLGEARARFAAGSVSEQDVITAQTNLAQALLGLSTVRTAVQISRANLNTAMGVDARTATSLADVPAPATTLPDLNALVDQALRDRPEVVQAAELVAASAADVSAARTSNLPALSADGSLGARGASLSSSVRDSSIEVSLSWDAFDAGLTRGRVREAEAGLEAARLTLTQTQQAVMNDVTQAYLNVADAQQRVVTTGSEVENAREALRLAEGRYRAGVAIFLEVIDAQNTLAASQASQAQAVYGLTTALAALDRAVGRGVPPAA